MNIFLIKQNIIFILRKLIKIRELEIIFDNIKAYVVIRIGRDVRIAETGIVNAAVDSHAVKNRIGRGGATVCAEFVDQRRIRTQATLAVVRVGSNRQDGFVAEVKAQSEASEHLLRLTDSDTCVRQIEEVADAITILEAACERYGSIVTQLRVGIEITVQTLAAASFDTDSGARLGTRCFGDDVDRAADRVAPVQRALGSAQHFDALDVGDVPVLPNLATKVYTVDVD